MERRSGQKSQGLWKVHEKKWFNFFSLIMSFSVLFYVDAHLQTLSTCRLTVLLSAILKIQISCRVSVASMQNFTSADVWISHV